MRNTAPGGDRPDWSRLSGSTGPGPRATALSITPVPGVPGTVRVRRARPAPPAPPSEPGSAASASDGETRRVVVEWDEHRWRGADVPSSIRDKDLTAWLSENWAAWYVDEGQSNGSTVTGWKAQA